VAGRAESIPTLHPNLPALYRRRVEALEEALADPAPAMAATEALRALIDAILVFPGQRRGELGAILRLAEGARAVGSGNGESPSVLAGAIVSQVKMDAGTRIGLCRTVLRGAKSLL